MNLIKAFVASTMVVIFGVAATFGQLAHFDVAGMDPKTSACADFYQYANGGWLTANPIPAAYSAWGVGNVLDEKNREMLHQILEAAARNTAVKKGSNEQKVGDYYDLKAFKERAQCVIDQFNGFEVEKGLNQNGKLVVGESIADLGGLVLAYAAFQKSMDGKPRPANMDGFTPEQRFFLGYARGRANNIRPEFARLLVNVDPHPLAKFRVNGPLSNMPQFAAAFQCKDGDPMLRAEKNRCVIW